MRSWWLSPILLVLAVGCSGVPAPYTSGGPIGPSVQNKRTTPPPEASANPQNGFEPGQILVKPSPGQTADDLKRQFGADNVTPYRPDGIDENLAIELGISDWFVIRVPEGDELGILSGLVENGDIVDAGLMPKGGGKQM